MCRIFDTKPGFRTAVNCGGGLRPRICLASLAIGPAYPDWVAQRGDGEGPLRRRSRHAKKGTRDLTDMPYPARKRLSACGVPRRAVASLGMTRERADDRPFPVVCLYFLVRDTGAKQIPDRRNLPRSSTVRDRRYKSWKYVFYLSRLVGLRSPTSLNRYPKVRDWAGAV